jgi:hypothetical protein
VIDNDDYVEIDIRFNDGTSLGIYHYGSNGERHCFFECFDAWRDFQQEWVAAEQRQEMMQQIEDVIYRGKVPAHLLEEDEVAAELKET